MPILSGEDLFIMSKNLKAVSLFLVSTVFLFQAGCSSTTALQPTSPANTLTNTPNGNNTNVQAKTSMTFLITQKDASGVVNPILPQDIESVTVNGKVYSGSDIVLTKGNSSFSVKSEGKIKLSFKNGRFVLEGNSGNTELNISFKLKGSNIPLTLPNMTLSQLSGDIRVEALRDSSGNITGFSGGLNKDGSLDTSNPIFNYDMSSNNLTIISSNGIKTTYQMDDLKTEVKVDTKKEEKISDPKKEAEEINKNVSKPSPVTAFVGAWKANLLGMADVKLNLRKSGTTDIGYKADMTAKDFKGSFNGSVTFSETTDVNKLDFSSSMEDNPIKGSISLSGDNALTLTITESGTEQVKPYLNIPVTLERGE